MGESKTPTMERGGVDLHGITKRFPGVVAVRNVTVHIRPGEILAIVGENGAGKSTLMKILAGVYPRHSFDGEIHIDGRSVSFRSVADAEEAGIVMIPQELIVVPELSVAENIFLNREGKFIVQTQDLEDRAAALLARFGVSINPHTPMKRLGTGQQQLVMLARALAREARIVIFDEPTASLSTREVSAFFDNMRRLRDSGIMCVFISHRIDEVFAVADRIVVMRDGERIASLERNGTTPDEVVSMMVGRDLGAMYLHRDRALGETLLKVVDFSVPSATDPGRVVVDRVNLDVRRGEIVGLFGLVGAGRTELACALFGWWPAKCTGDIYLGGRKVVIRSCRDAIRFGLGLLPEDRKRLGLFPNMTLDENVNIGSFERVSRFQLIHSVSALRRTEVLGRQLAIKSSSWSAPVVSLSGGNQQKVLLARLLAMEPRVLILDEPTHGIDVGAKAEFFRLLDELVGRGIGVLMISSELREVLGVCDRILVMYKGRITARFPRYAATEERVLRAATGGEVQDTPAGGDTGT